jgi:hypothetical protein
MQPKHLEFLGKDYRLGSEYGPIQLNFRRIPIKSELIEQLLYKLKFIKQEKNQEF